MAYEPWRNHEQYNNPSSYTSGTVWSGMTNKMAGHQYTSLPSPYEPHAQPLPNVSGPSSINEFQHFEQETPHSSTTGFLSRLNRRNNPIPGTYQRLTGHPWRPGFWAQFPWMGIVALFIATLATLACVIVLLKSQNVPIEQWNGRFQPTVYLSIATATANVALTYALYEGMVISFWRKASRGATLRELHQYWASGSSLYGAFTGLFRFHGKAVAIACIMTVLSIGRGPLMQRASLVKNIVVQQRGSLQMYSALELPYDYAGFDSGRTSTPSYMKPNFTAILQRYTMRQDIIGTWSGCESTCYADVKGFGFGVSCNVTDVPYVLDPTIVNGSVTDLPTVQVFSADAWEIETFDNAPPPNNYALLLNTTLLDTQTQAWNGSLKQNLCALRAGIVSYPIKISNGTITLQSSFWENDTYLEDVGFEYLPYNAPSNIAGWILAAKALWYGTATMQFGGGAGWILNLDGASSNSYITRTNMSTNDYEIGATMTWQDPMDDMIDSMRELAFRTSLQIANDNTSYPNASQVVPYSGNRPETVYTSNTSYMIGAVVLSLAGVLAVLPTYRGFWELGRPVSMSPLEVAKAFNAPLLSSVQGNRTAEDMLVELGATKVRYGDAGIVGGEQVSSVYGRTDVVRKIEIGPAASLLPLEKGARYV